MAKYMIHACTDRMHYVEFYLIPSMVEQGIDKSDIILYADSGDGCLQSHVKSFMQASHLPYDGVWHLQDDVLICSDFKERTEKYDNGLVCGFASYYDSRKNWKEGEATGKNMWYSFPCMRIPTAIITHYVNWFNTWVWRDNQYKHWVDENKHDDTIFRIFMENYYPKYPALNLAPNLVEHIDWLIGGSIVNAFRKDKIVRSIYWNDEDRVEELKERLKNDLYYRQTKC